MPTGLRFAAILAGAVAVTGVVVATLREPEPPAPTPVPSPPAIVGRVEVRVPSAPRAPVVAPPAPAPTRTAPHYELSGVVAPNGGARSGFALISIDGGPAHLFRVGAPVGSDLVLQSVGASSASLATPSGRPMVTLELAQPGATAAAATSRPVAPAAAPRAVRPAPPPTAAASGVPDPMTPEGSSEAPPHSN